MSVWEDVESVAGRAAGGAAKSSNVGEFRASEVAVSTWYAADGLLAARGVPSKAGATKGSAGTGGAADGGLGGSVSDGEGHDPTQLKKMKKRVPTLQPADLFDRAKGIRKISDEFPKMKFKGRGHEARDLKKLLVQYKEWAYEMHPYLAFEDVTAKMSKWSHGAIVTAEMNKARERERARRWPDEFHYMSEDEMMGGANGGASTDDEAGAGYHEPPEGADEFGFDDAFGVDPDAAAALDAAEAAARAVQAEEDATREFEEAERAAAEAEELGAPEDLGGAVGSTSRQGEAASSRPMPQEPEMQDSDDDGAAGVAAVGAVPADSNPTSAADSEMQ